MTAYNSGMAGVQMADQIILKHIREAVGKVQLHELEIELRLNGTLTEKQFQEVERRLSSAKWDHCTYTESSDAMVGNVRVTTTDKCRFAIQKDKVQVTDTGPFRVITSLERRVNVPTGNCDASMIRHKKRKELSHWGWKLSLTVVNGSMYEIEVELDSTYLVRRPYDLLAQAGAKLMTDVVEMLTQG